MRLDKVLLTLDVRLKTTDLLQYLPCSVNIIGRALAEIAIQYETENRTAYYPAIEFFKTHNNIDPQLIESAEQVSWLVAKLVREIIQKKLQSIFSSVQFLSIQTLAFNMPKVRPNQAGASEKLISHYTPDTVKIELVLTMMRHNSDHADDRAEPYARKMIFRWLKAEFENITITASKKYSE